MRGSGAIALLLLLLGGCSVELVPTSPPMPTQSADPPTSLPAPTGDATREPGLPDAAAGLPYTCAGGAPFDVTMFALPPTAETADDPAAAALRKVQPRPGWWLTDQTATDAYFLSRNGPTIFWYITLGKEADGSWQWRGEGDCETTMWVEGLATVRWVLDDSHPVGPGTQVIRAIVTQPCYPDPLADRLQPAIIRSTEDTVLVVFTVAPGRGLVRPADARAARAVNRVVASLGRMGHAALFDHCAPGPSLEVEVDLGQPLGDRLLVDGATWPARDARQPLEP